MEDIHQLDMAKLQVAVDVDSMEVEQLHQEEEQELKYIVNLVQLQ